MADTKITQARTVLYAGRSTDGVAKASLPPECEVLDDRDVSPARLAAALEGAQALVVADLFSFPYESLTNTGWDTPIVVILPTGFDAEFLQTVFGAPLFERLGFFDRVATADAAVWEKLQARYAWPKSRRMQVSDPQGAAAEVCAALAAEASASLPPPEDYEAYSYWRALGDGLARTAPHRTAVVSRRGFALDKATDRVQAAAFMGQVVDARGGRTEDAPLRMLEVGSGAGRWASRLDASTTEYVGVDLSESLVRAARADYPHHRFEVVGEDSRLPQVDESFDLVFTVGVLAHNTPEVRRAWISEMWRVARPGARMFFLEDFVTDGEDPTVYRMPVREFVQDVIESTAGQVVLQHVESLRYPGDTFVRGGLIALTRLGVPKTW